MPKLLVLNSAGDARHVELKPHKNTIGRSVMNDIVLNSASASRRHAVVTVGSAFTVIRDTGSQNGTFVNGTRVETQSLVDGDVVHIGECELRFVAGDQEFSEVEAISLSPTPGWLSDDPDGTLPTR